MHRPLVKKSARRPPTPVRSSSHAFVSKLASPVAWLHPPYPCEKFFDSSTAIVRLANAACKPCDAPCAHPSSEVQVHERGRRPPIQSPISVTHIVPHNLSGHIRNGRRFKARLVTRLSNNSYELHGSLQSTINMPGHLVWTRTEVYRFVAPRSWRNGRGRRAILAFALPRRYSSQSS